MKLRTGILGLALTSVVALASANAADMYVPGPVGGGYKDGPVAGPLWNGPYVGINGGYAWGANSDLKATCIIEDTTESIACRREIPNGLSKSFASQGGFGGGQIGYNWQPAGAGGYKDGPAYSNFVFGVEADIQGADITGSGTISGGGGTVTATDTLDWFGTVRGRVGYAFGAALLYGTGGFAYGGIDDKLSGTGGSKEKSYTGTGYAAGGGLEYAFNPAWSAKVEYLYINLGSDTLTAHVPPHDVSAKFDHEYNTVRVGLNYHILPGYEPLK